MARPLEFDRNEAVQKAMQLFLRQGYEGTSIGDLTEELGISRASLYNCFGDKRGLMLATIGCAEQIGAEIRKGALGKKGPAAKVIRGFFEQLVNSYILCGAAPGCVFLTLGAELSSTDPEVQQRVDASLEASRNLFREILSREGKWTAKEVDAKAASLLSTLIGVLMLLRLKRDPALLNNVLKESLTVLD
jgi:TetR/AcrR family transcriptional repressor of nem operon